MSAPVALTFIGQGPSVLPIPPGLEHDPRRFVGTSAPRPEHRPATPSQVKIRYSVTDREGRLKTEYADIAPLPEGCTAKELISIIHEHGPLRLQQLSIRNPVELRHQGRPIGFEERLDAYAIKDRSELQLVVKPKLSHYLAIKAGDLNVTRVRIGSHKLSMPTFIDGLTNETTVLELKMRLSEKFKAFPSWLVRGPVPPVQSGPRPPVTVQNADGENVELRVGEQFVKEGAPATGGGKDKKGAAGMLRRVHDGLLLEQAKLEPELWMITLDVENDKWFQLLHDGSVTRPTRAPTRARPNARVHTRAPAYARPHARTRMRVPTRARPHVHAHACAPTRARVPCRTPQSDPCRARRVSRPHTKDASPRCAQHDTFPVRLTIQSPHVRVGCHSRTRTRLVA